MDNNYGRQWLLGIRLQDSAFLSEVECVINAPVWLRLRPDTVDPNRLYTVLEIWWGGVLLNCHVGTYFFKINLSLFKTQAYLFWFIISQQRGKTSWEKKEYDTKLHLRVRRRFWKPGEWTSFIGIFTGLLCTGLILPIRFHLWVK